MSDEAPVTIREIVQIATNEDIPLEKRKVLIESMCRELVHTGRRQIFNQFNEALEEANKRATIMITKLLEWEYKGVDMPERLQRQRVKPTLKLAAPQTDQSQSPESEK